VRENNLKIAGENPFVAAAAAPPAADVRGKVIATAKKYLGVPYVWGGTSSRGFDCSGLVQTVFAENGVALPRGSGDQYRQGRKVARKNLRTGDLVFFHTYTSGPSHVGIYVGDGKFLHAESSPRGVTITPLSEPYWDERFLGARTWLAD
jgi:cell wall-associated NlpC family hydrolase